MSYCHISDELCPEINLETERRFYESRLAPLLFLWESFPAVIAPERLKGFPLPVFVDGPGPAMLGGRGVMFFSLYAPDAEKTCLTILKDTLFRLDIAAEIKKDCLFADGYMCCSSRTKKSGAWVSGALYYGIPQNELSRASSVLGADCMSLSLLNPGLSKSFLFGAVRYSFELEYGKSEYIGAPQQDVKCL